jgi:hypothetical protein
LKWPSNILAISKWDAIVMITGVIKTTGKAKQMFCGIFNRILDRGDSRN